MEGIVIKAIAIDIDDTLNNFTETLQSTPFVYSDAYGITEEKFIEYMGLIRNNVKNVGDLLSTEYASLRYKIHEQCYKLARARTDGVEFMQWLRKNDWTIVICTFRDLRRAADATKVWLKANNIPFDYLFYSQNKAAFCSLWNIKYLIDDADFNVKHGALYGVNVYFPIMKKHINAEEITTARGFSTFDEVKQWIKE
jgi:hypothetical protein